MVENGIKIYLGKLLSELHFFCIVDFYSIIFAIILLYAVNI